MVSSLIKYKMVSVFLNNSFGRTDTSIIDNRMTLAPVLLFTVLENICTPISPFQLGIMIISNDKYFGVMGYVKVSYLFRVKVAITLSVMDIRPHLSIFSSPNTWHIS